MTGRLGGRTTVVTGAGSEIGAAADAVVSGIVTAGGAALAVPLDVTERETVRAGIATTVVLIGTQDAAQQSIRQGGPGEIVDTASIAGRTGFADVAPCSASKAAAISLTQAGARDLAPRGITVNAFAPGVVATPLWTQPEDVVPTGIFLAGPDSDDVTGQVMAIEGGMILVRGPTERVVGPRRPVSLRGPPAPGP